MQMEMRLDYNMKTEDGATLGVWNEKKTSSHLDYYVGPFETTDEAKQFADNYTDSWRLGYNGRGRVTEINHSIYVACSRWTSCD